MYASNTATSASTQLTWTTWNVTAANATTALTVTAGDIMWRAWNMSSTGYTTATATTINCWPAWLQAPATVRAVQPRAQPTAEQLERWRAEEIRRREADDERAKAALLARERAKNLLEQSLSAEQLEELKQKDCFHVESISADGTRRRYQIRRGTHGNVKLLGANGQPLESLCIQPPDVPVEDAMLAQKLMLETDEAEFRRIANISAVGRR